MKTRVIFGSITLTYLILTLFLSIMFEFFSPWYQIHLGGKVVFDFFISGIFVEPYQFRLMTLENTYQFRKTVLTLLLVDIFLMFLVCIGSFIFFGLSTTFKTHIIARFFSIWTVLSICIRIAVLIVMVVMMPKSLKKDNAFCETDTTNSPCESAFGHNSNSIIESKTQTLQWGLSYGYWIHVTQLILAIAYMTMLLWCLRKPFEMNENINEPESELPIAQPSS
eukprot:TRINITY_DN10472_c0_g1_i1.p1 TRINITY_DN10472_c0_g1~~TRINITY_DN10472_c0_g1_i1.p1  ORF type:complete len:223 (+),score=22.45 TRINITY_DN10472_c0_g1_i1:23-691(+)